MARREPRPGPGRIGSWLVSALLLGAIAAALWGFTPLLRGIDWWIGTVALLAVVLLAAGVTRVLTPRRWVPPLVALGVALAALTLSFAAPTSLLGVIPTGSTFEAFRLLELAGVQDITEQTIPARATEGIRFLVALGAAAAAILADLLATALRIPALAGLPLLVLVAVPGFVRAEFVDPGIFAIVAAAWLAVMLVHARPPSARTGLVSGAVALVGALVVALILPSVEPPSPSRGGSGDFATGLNPILTLGDDLRRGNPMLALTYVPDDEVGQYLRMTVLDDFSGRSWEPSTTPDPENDIAQFGTIPGLGPDIPTTDVIVDIEVANVLSRWLPVPYAARSITGLDGDWAWEPDGLTVRTERSNVRGQSYTVAAQQPAPSVEQLLASAALPVTEMDRYLDLPAELPASVVDTAREVTAGRATPYEQALALQGFFRDGDFVYSEQAPVEADYDGSGAEVLGRFLEERSGYCVHFSSAMAAMARSLGIPARVVVGFTPGSSVNTDDGRQFRVTTHNLHAWPELNFPGIGWVRFEPTPGRGSPPSFAPLDRDDPSTPDVDESVPPPAEPDPQDPGATPTPTAAPDLPEEEPTDPGASGTVGGARGMPWGVIVGVVVAASLLAPAFVRTLRRIRRQVAVRQGSALAAWDELRDLADDFGWGSDVGLTPRQLAADLDGQLDDRGRAALGRLLSAVEHEVFAREGSSTSVSDVRSVLWSLRRTAGPARAAAAWLLPRSLIRPWLPSARPVD